MAKIKYEIFKPIWRKVKLILLAIIFLICTFAPFVYWLLNPELTQIQIFIKFWWVMLIGIASGYAFILHEI